MRHYYAADRQGTVLAMIDAARIVTNQYRYDSYGAAEYVSEGVPKRLRWIGREWDADAALYYVRARWYEPTLQRFISEDPIGLEGGINLYAYAGNDPVNFEDHSGLRIAECGWEDYRAGRCDAFTLPGLTIYASDLSFRWLRMRMRDDAQSCTWDCPSLLQGADLGLTRPRPTQLDPATRLLLFNYAQGLQNLAECTVEQYDELLEIGLRAASWIGAMPFDKRAHGLKVVRGASESTTVLNQTLRQTVGPLKLPNRFGGTLLRRVAGSNKLTTVIGRANILLARALVVYDAASIFACSASR